MDFMAVQMLMDNHCPHGGRTGTAAVLFWSWQDRHSIVRQMHLSTKDEHNTYEAEAAGGILAFHLLKDTKPNLNDAVEVFSNNQSLLKNIFLPKAKSG